MTLESPVAPEGSTYTERKINKPSEFERRGPRKFGAFGIMRAWEKMRLVYRTGQAEEPLEAANLDATPDDWGTGGAK